MALRRHLEAHFKHFCAQLAKWFSGALWRFILRISGPRKFLEAHFEHFCAQLAKWLSGLLYRLILSISEPSGSLL